ncbi:hypothetical protein [Halomonas sp. BN3-1]|uniref:hypothetical protein n=1 Tax=Halomonas sp. BN3-1 TaxID=2082393 RepID=UPI000D37C925|nr:hypothetical protein [Halomonas sp. BN3-1]
MSSVREAYQAMAAKAGLRDHESKILAALRWFGPMTRHRISEITGIKLASVYCRCWELSRVGQLRLVGRELLGKGRSRGIVEGAPDMVDLMEGKA